MAKQAIAAISTGETALRLQDLRVAYRLNGRSVNVLDGFSLELSHGEIVALLGESGSGKSTVAKAMTGLLPRSARIGSGALQIGRGVSSDLSGERVPWERIRGRGIAMLFQDAQQSLNPMLTIKEHFKESLLYHRLVAAGEVQAESVKWLQALRFPDAPGVLERYPFQLSGGMCQRICLALALSLRPAVLVADEPTSALDAVSQKEVLDLLQSMQRQLGLAVLFITHDLAVAHAISDRVVVLNKGVVEEEGDTRTVLARPQSACTRRLLASRAQIAGLAPAGGPLRQRAPLLDIVGLAKTFPPRKQRVLHDLHLTVHEREIVGVLGQSGCGKSTLARCIAGLEIPDAGRILYCGAEIGRLRGKPRRELSKQIQLVFQDARASLNPRRTALQLVQEPLRYGRIGGRAEREMRAMFYLNEAGIGEELHKRRPPELSTGQCQRIAIARALALQPRLLICDEAVSALDMSVQAQILQLLQRLHRQYGFAVLMISHDIRVLRSFCHSIAVMDQGRFCEVKRGGALLRESSQPYTQLLLKCAGDLEIGLGDGGAAGETDE